MNQRGFAHTLTFLIITFVVAISVAGWRIYSLQRDEPDQNQEQDDSQQEQTSAPRKELFCTPDQIAAATSEGPDCTVRSEALQLKPSQPAQVEIFPRRDKARFNFQKKGNDYTYRLITPTGRVISATTDEFDVQITINSSVEFYDIHRPEAGMWRLEAVGAGSGFGEVRVFQDDIPNGLPQAMLDPPVQLDAAGSKYRFDASRSSDPDSALSDDDFIWDYGDGFADSGKVVEHQFFTPGRYTVRVRVVDNKDESAEATVVVDVP